MLEKNKKNKKKQKNKKSSGEAEKRERERERERNMQIEKYSHYSFLISLLEEKIIIIIKKGMILLYHTLSIN